MGSASAVPTQLRVPRSTCVARLDRPPVLLAPTASAERLRASLVFFGPAIAPSSRLASARSSCPSTQPQQYLTSLGDEARVRTSPLIAPAGCLPAPRCCGGDATLGQAPLAGG